MKIIQIKKYLKTTIWVVIVLVALFLIFDNIVMPIYVQKGKTTKVPNVIGISLNQAKKNLKDAGLEPKISEYKSDKRYDVGTVILQNPLAETEVKFGRGVYLTVSGGEELVEVPNLRGKSIREATFTLERVGLKLGLVSYEPSDEMFANTIIRQNISPGTKVTEDKKVDIFVSQGKATDKHAIPDVALRTMTEAEKILIDNGFKIGKITYQANPDLLPNTILEQMPKAGEQAKIGDTVDLIVVQKLNKK